MARRGLEPRASRLPCEHSANWATKPLGWPGFESQSSYDFPPNWPPNVTGEEKLWPDQDSNPGPLTNHVSTMPTELTSHLVFL